MMAQVAMTIGGRVYRLACDEGEEARLAELAGLIDARIADMRGKFGEMGDQRLTIMAAVTIADELYESKRRAGALEAELAALQSGVAEALAGREAWIDRVALSLDEAAERIESLAQNLNGASRGEE